MEWLILIFATCGLLISMNRFVYTMPMCEGAPLKYWVRFLAYLLLTVEMMWIALWAIDPSIITRMTP